MAGPRDAVTGRKAMRTRARLLSAAREVFSEVGYWDSRVVEIARRAGTSYGTFYTYFIDKQDALLALTADVAIKLSGISQLSPAEPPVRTGAPLLAFRARALIDAYAGDAGLLRAWRQAATLDRRTEERRLRLRDTVAEGFAEQLDRDQRHGLIAPQLDITIAAVALTHMIEAFVEDWVERGRPVDDRIADQLTSLCLGALYGAPVRFHTSRGERD
jgi:AcrR family transcriptional regulator